MMMRWPPLIALLCLALLLLTRAVGVPGVSRLGIVVSELMYAPLPPSDEEREAGNVDAAAFEFVEIRNASLESVDCAGLELDGDVGGFGLVAGDSGVLVAGESVVVVADAEAFAMRYGSELRVLGTFSGVLPDDGGQLEVRLPLRDEAALGFRYEVVAPWPTTPRGLGFSLVMEDPEENPDHGLSASWRSSSVAGGSPGEDDPERTTLPVVISEVLPKGAVLDTYYRIASYPTVPSQAPTAFMQAYVEDMKADPYHFSFVHLVSPDFVGHRFNWYSPQQDEAIKAVDVDLGEVFRLVDEDERLRGKTAIILTADHGGGGGGVLNNHTDPIWPINYTISFHVWGPGIPPGAELYGMNAETRTVPAEDANPPFVAETKMMPIRNGALGNLGMDLLGLPAIPGSWINGDHSLVTGAEGVEYVIGISVDGLAPPSIQRLGEEHLPNLFRLRREGAYTDRARTDATQTKTNPNHTCMLTGRGTLDAAGVGRGHRITFNSDVFTTLEAWNGGFYIASAFDVVNAFGMRTAFYSNKTKLDFLGRSYGAINGDAVELYNPNPVAVNVGGWGLTDDPAMPLKFVIPGNTTVPAGGRLVLSEDPGWRSSMRPTPLATHFGGAFTLEPDGGQVYLFDAANGVLSGQDHGLVYDPLLPGLSAIREVVDGGERGAMASAVTLGLPNAPPYQSAFVITEIGSMSDGSAFVEMRNVSEGAILLGPEFKLAGSYSFTFPDFFVVQSGELVVIALDPVGLEVPEGAVVLGPLISNGAVGGVLDVAFVVERAGPEAQSLDQVRVKDSSVWPENVLSVGHAIERRNLEAFGDDPENWTLSAEVGGSPGALVSGRYEDWVARNLGAVDFSEKEMDADPDGDGRGNFYEYAFASNPLDAGSFADPLWLESGVRQRLVVQRPRTVVDVRYVVEVSSDLVRWRSAGNGEVISLGERVSLDDEREEVGFLLLAGANPGFYLRVRAIYREL
jgi:hypothetical protein